MLATTLFPLAYLLPLVSAATHPKRAASTVIPSSCFDNYKALESYFSYLYPWGSDHNGAARMVGNSSYHEYISIRTAGTLTLTAVPVTGQPDTSSGLAIHYLSGTVYANKHLAVAAGSGGLDLSAEFKASVVRGSWPAFWLTAVEGWPPEADIAEWKGTGDISFNTFNTSSEVASKNVDYPNPDEWHTVKAELRDENGSDASIAYYLDGELITTQYGKGFVGAALYLIVDLQMEGSSGAPGPKTNTTYSIKNLKVISYD